MRRRTCSELNFSEVDLAQFEILGWGGLGLGGPIKAETGSRRVQRVNRRHYRRHDHCLSFDLGPSRTSTKQEERVNDNLFGVQADQSRDQLL